MSRKILERDPSLQMLGLSKACCGCGCFEVERAILQRLWRIAANELKLGNLNQKSLVPWAGKVDTITRSVSLSKKQYYHRNPRP